MNFKETVEKNLQPGMARYFIALVPPSPVFEEALSLKAYFKEKYNSRAALNSPPHITLHMPFLWKESKEEKLVYSLNEFASQQHAFHIEVTGFSSFPPRVIFMAIAANEKLIATQRALNRFCKMELKLFNAEYKDLPFHPHITLAFRDLKKQQFELAWKEFEGKSFSSQFNCNKITLLKHDGKVWQQHQHFSLLADLPTLD